MSTGSTPPQANTCNQNRRAKPPYIEETKPEKELLLCKQMFHWLITRGACTPAFPSPRCTHLGTTNSISPILTEHDVFAHSGGTP